MNNESLLGHPEPTRGDPSNLGPGRYSVSDSWQSSSARHPGYKRAAFGSESAKLSSLKSNSITPGPGRYKQDVDLKKTFKPITNTREAVFGVQSSRFSPSTTYTPGPGHYSSDGTVVRKSFNITYG